MEEDEHAEWSTWYGDMSNRSKPSKPPAGNFPGGVPPGGAFQKRVFRGHAAPRAAATLFDMGGGLNVRSPSLTLPLSLSARLPLCHSLVQTPTITTPSWRWWQCAGEAGTARVALRPL